MDQNLEPIGTRKGLDRNMIGLRLLNTARINIIDPKFHWKVPDLTQLSKITNKGISQNFPFPYLG